MRYQDGDLDFENKKSVGELEMVKIQPKDDIIVDEKTPTL